MQVPGSSARLTWVFALTTVYHISRKMKLYGWSVLMTCGEGICENVYGDGERQPLL